MLPLRLHVTYQLFFSHAPNSYQFGMVMLVCQVAFIILFGLFVRYDGGEGFDGKDEELSRLYPC